MPVPQRKLSGSRRAAKEGRGWQEVEMLQITGSIIMYKIRSTLKGYRPLTLLPFGRTIVNYSTVWMKLYFTEMQVCVIFNREAPRCCAVSCKHCTGVFFLSLIFKD